ncbi:MAG: Mu-like prophage major head subunit gpT family protein [Bacteroidetes bacterium]|nr:Mu-like prophage major head subunit gpT family protein [Bacteroidota bacterium]
MATIVNANIRKAADTAFMHALGSQLVSQPWRNAALYYPGKGEITKFFNWLGDVSGVKRWRDERSIQAVGTHSHSVTSLKWEDTIGIEVNAMNEDGPLIQQKVNELAAKFVQHYNKLFFDFLKAGDGAQATGGAKATYPWAGCFDTQTFFSNSHPIYNPDPGVGTTNDNIVTGTGVDTVAHIKADFDSAVQQFYNLIRRDGSPMYDSVPEPLTIYCASEDIALFNQVFKSPTDIAAGSAPNFYNGRANVVASPHLNTSTTYDVNDHGVTTYSTSDWFVQLPVPEKPFILYESSPLETSWDESFKFMKDTLFYGGKGMYNFGYAYWQTMMKVYNA